MIITTYVCDKCGRQIDKNEGLSDHLRFEIKDYPVPFFNFKVSIDSFDACVGRDRDFNKALCGKCFKAVFDDIITKLTPPGAVLSVGEMAPWDIAKFCPPGKKAV